MKITEIQNPAFLKDLSIEDLKKLAEDIRAYIIATVAKNGGHLSSNLGVVELTIALHRVFNAPEDRIFFDVGHQSYTHKILTGRALQFPTLRQFKGLAGYQKLNESPYDCFDSGHSSNSLSNALGMAVARDLNKENYQIIPVIGDGALSSGMAMEALNQIGYQRRNMIIIFNDNQMSISKNVGALTKGFANLRSSRSYNSLKYSVKDFLYDQKYGNTIIKGIHKFKKAIKDSVIDSGIFNDFDIDYLGPVDGHDFNDLFNALEAARLKDGPVVVHVVTKKGKGYKYAEDDLAGKWHGISPFNIATGKPLKETPANYKSYSAVVADKLEKMMIDDPDIVIITPAMISGSALSSLFARFPDRCFDVGIAEEHAVSFAAGLALNGKKPFVAMYSSFSQRAYDQINHDVCRLNLPVVFGIDRAGIVGEDGDTHQGIFDISYLRSLPNMTISQGCDSKETEDLLLAAFYQHGPFTVRYSRGSCLYQESNSKSAIKVGKWDYLLARKDPKAIIITYGNDIAAIYQNIIDNNLPYDLVNARFIKPIDEEMMHIIANNKAEIFVYTNEMIRGGLGDEILEYLNSCGINRHIEIIGVDDAYVRHGSLKQVRESLNIDVKSLFEKIESKLNVKKPEN